MKDYDEVFEKIRKGDKEEAKEAFDSLMNTTLRGVIVAIISRNFSHSMGRILKKIFKNKNKPKK